MQTRADSCTATSSCACRPRPGDLGQVLGLYDRAVADIDAISKFLQDRLRQTGMEEVFAIEAASWLTSAGLLDDSLSRPGLPLRNFLRDGKIRHAEQRPTTRNGRWFIVRSRETALDPPDSAAITAHDEMEVATAAASGSAGTASKEADTRPPRRETEAPDAIGFTRNGLEAAGFKGFVAFKDIDVHRLPPEPGVYAVLRESETRPVFLDANPAGWFKGLDPTVPVAELEAAWPEGAQCVYIGKANSLRRRITQFRQYGDGRPVGHQGGRRIWQLADADDYILAWLPTSGVDPEDVEGDLIRAFVAEYGQKPIGNRTLGRRR